MHLLPCPACQSTITVSPSQAGGQTQCPGCHQTVEIPKLGDLRQLPISEADHGSKSAHFGGRESRPETQSGHRSAFVLLGMIAAASLLIAGFCAIRWVMIETPMTTQEHLDEFHQTYKTLNPAELIREYEQMEQTGLELPVPFTYKMVASEKHGWGRNASITAAIGGLAILAALALSVAGRRNPKPPADT